MSYKSAEFQTIEIYSYLLNQSVPKDDKYWQLFFETPFHYISLSSIFENLTVKQVHEHTGVLKQLFREGLQRLDNTNALNIIRIFIRFLTTKNYGNSKNQVILQLFGDINSLQDNFLKILKKIKYNLRDEADDRSKFISFKLFSTCIKSFYDTIAFEIFYQVDMNDELYNIFLIDDLEFEVIGELLVTLSILNENALISSNFYKLKIDKVFDKAQILSNINYQLKQFFVFGTIFYHDLKPDLLNKKEQLSTFYNWVTFNRYNVKVSDFKAIFLSNLDDEDLKVYLNLRLDRYKKKNELLKEMLPVYLFFHSLIMNNEEYCGLITTRLSSYDSDSGELDFFEVFLSLTSFIFQYSNSYNSIILRLALLIINNLVTKKADNLKDYDINQYQVKICYQRPPIVTPVGEIEYLKEEVTGEELEMVKSKNSLYYILDIVQCQMRFNLSKKLDLILYKLSNLVILRILNELDYSLDYNWHDFLLTIFQTFNFLMKNFDYTKESKILALIEELLVIMEILIINFDREQETKKFELVELMYKILEHNEKLLIVKLYQNGNVPNLTILLNLMITKFLNKNADLNYNEIYEKLSEFIEKDEDYKTTQVGLFDKMLRGDILFENDETFKYLQMKNISSVNKISLISKSIQQLNDDYKLFY